MATTTKYVFQFLIVVAWIIFTGLSIEAGGLIVNFGVSLYEPDILQNLYQKLDLLALLKEDKGAFFAAYSFILSIAILKAWLFYVVVKLVHKMDITNPFTFLAAEQIFQISYFTLSIGGLSYIAQKWAKHYDNIEGFSTHLADSQAFILMGAVLYIIATIFKRGVQIQNENDLTV